MRDAMRLFKKKCISPKLPGYIIGALFSLIVMPTAHGDMGRITTSDAVVTEDFQRAIIFHTIDEEILILGTDLEGERKTAVLRFIPFPSLDGEIKKLQK